MVIRRGDIWWADLAEPRGSAPGYRRPVIVIQSDEINASRLRTVTVVPLTSNLVHGELRCNVVLPRSSTRLPKDCVALATQIDTVDRDDLAEKVGKLSAALIRSLDRGIAEAIDLRSP